MLLWHRIHAQHERDGALMNGRLAQSGGRPGWRGI